MRCLNTFFFAGTAPVIEVQAYNTIPRCTTNPIEVLTSIASAHFLQPSLPTHTCTSTLLPMMHQHKSTRQTHSLGGPIWCEANNEHPGLGTTATEKLHRQHQTLGTDSPANRTTSLPLHSLERQCWTGEGQDQPSIPSTNPPSTNPSSIPNPQIITAMSRWQIRNRQLHSRQNSIVDD